MADPHVLTDLVAKRAEIAGQIEHTQLKLRQLVIDLDHIDASIDISTFRGCLTVADPCTSVSVTWGAILASARQRW